MDRNVRTRPAAKIIIMVVAALSLLGAPSAAENPSDQGPSAAGGVVRVQDAEVAYEDLGQGIPVVMLHGFGVDRRTMKGCMEPVFSQRSGWRRLYFDLPGMGVTGPVQSVRSSDGMLDFALEFINKILPDEKFLVVGESYGGYLAQGIVYKHPERVLGMLLICPMVVADDAKRDLEPRTVIEKDDSLLQELEPFERDLFARFSVVQNRTSWERFKAEMVSGMGVGSFDYLTKIRRSPQAYAFSFDVESLPRKFLGPSLILAGRQDHLAGYRDLWRIVENYPRSSFILLDRAGHALQIDQEEVFNALVVEWLDRVEGGGQCSPEGERAQVSLTPDGTERIQMVEEGLAPAYILEGVNDRQPRWGLGERMKHWHVPGVSVAVINDGVIEWAKGYGEVEPDGRAVDTETIFQTGSLGKTLTAMTVPRRGGGSGRRAAPWSGAGCVLSRPTR